jgi:hypothetical protein
LASVDGGQNFLEGIIEDELISIFTRLDLDVWACHEAEHIAMHLDLQKVAMDIIQAIPKQGFADLRAARKYFDILLTQVDLLVYSIDEQLWIASDDSVEPRPVIQIDEHTGVIKPSASQGDRAAALKQGILSWRTAFGRILTRSLKSGGNESLIAKALCLRLVCSSMALNCCFDAELSYDSYIPEFRTALSLSESLSAATSPKTNPTFIVTSILIRSLYFITLKCRNIPLRTEAIKILQSMTRREGIWDSRVASTVATVAMELEEDDPDGFVPEHKRLRTIKNSFDLHKRQGRMRYLTTKTDSGAIKLVNRQLELSW